MNLTRNSQLDFVRKSYSFLNAKERKTLASVSAGQILLALFDVVGVSFFGAIASLVMSSINAQPPAQIVQNLLSVLQLDGMSLQIQTASLAVVGVLILGIKTILTYKLSNIILRTLSITSARVSRDLLSKIFNIETNYLKIKNDQEILYNLTTGVSVLTVGVLGVLTTLLSDLALLVVIFFGVLYLNVSVAIFTAVMFVGVLIILRKFIDFKAHAFSKEATSAAISSNTTVMEILENMSAISITGSGDYFADKVYLQRMKLNKVLAQQTLLPNIGKSILEVSVLFGVLLISGLEFLLYDSKQAILNLSIFLISASRVTPAVLRIQYGLLQTKSSSGTCESALSLINKLQEHKSNTKEFVSAENNSDLSHKSTKIKYAYSESEFVLEVEELVIPKGKFVAIVGPSGGGKSTLVKILAGLIKQDSGEIKYMGRNIHQVVHETPGLVSYVPQRVGLISEDLKSNVTFGRDFPLSVIRKSLRVSDLSEWTGPESELIDLQLKSDPTSVSGGQRQRLGIARAIISNPKILFLDEATSAIDGHSEMVILKNIRENDPEMSLVVVAHRLSSVENADFLLYIDKGKLVASGTFQELRGKVQAFDKQAQSMGF